MNMIAPSVFSDAKKSDLFCNAVWDGKGQLVNQPVFCPQNSLAYTAEKHGSVTFCE